MKCVRCGQGHSWENCPVKDDLTQAVCVNCKGRHSAAYKGCSKYQEVSKVLKVAAVDQVSYRDALIKVRSGGDVLQHPVRGFTLYCCWWSEDLHTDTDCSAIDIEPSSKAQAAISETQAVP